MIKIYTDGATRPTNPGPSGYGVVIKYGSGSHELQGYIGDNATNNQAEYMAVIVGLDTALSTQLGNMGGKLQIISDSQLVIEQLSGRWALKSAKLHILYQKAMSIVEILTANGVKVEFIQIKGHSGIPDNEKADQLAGEAVLRKKIAPEWVLSLMEECQDLANQEKGHEKLEKLILPWLNKRVQQVGKFETSLSKQSLHAAGHVGAEFLAYVPNVVLLTPKQVYMIVWTTGYQMINGRAVRTMDQKAYRAAQFMALSPVKVLYVHKPHGGGRFRRMNELGWNSLDVGEAPAMVSEDVEVVQTHQNPGWPVFVEIESPKGWTEVKHYFNRELAR